VTEKLELTANNFGSISGKRLFISPDVLNKSSIKIAGADKRKFDIKIPYAFTDVDSVEITIPAGYTAESIPANVHIDTKFGSYSTTITINERKISYVRNLQRNSGRYPATDAVLLADFFSKIYSADRSKLVFVKKD
jgi:hypothetical protein